MLRIIAILLSLIVTASAVAPAHAQDGGQRRTLFDLLFGEPEQAAPPVEQPRRQPTQRPQQQAPSQPQAPSPPTSAPPPEPAPVVQPSVVKAEDATRVAVFGDSMAVDLADALIRLYAQDPNIVIVGQAYLTSGFVRDDVFDWPAAVEAEIAADSFDLAVISIGINDRQDLTVQDAALPALSEPWTTAYRARIADFIATLRAAGKPVIWAGLPPMGSADYSQAISQINAIQRLASVSGGAEFVDVYDRFLGADGGYSAYGPDINGQNVRLRRDDGIHFSAAGADKLAFFMDQAIARFHREGGFTGGTTARIADPLSGTDAAGMLRPPFQGLGQGRLLEVAGAVTPLTPTAGRANDLITIAPGTGTSAPFALEDLFGAPSGRADAFGAARPPATGPDAPQAL